MTNYKMKKRILSMIIIFMVFSLCVFSSFADYNVDYDIHFDDGFIYITLRNYNNYAILPQGYQWRIRQSSNSYTLGTDETILNSNWWFIVPNITNLGSGQIKPIFYDLSDMPLGVEATVTYKMLGYGALQGNEDDFRSIFVYGLKNRTYITNDFYAVVNGQNVTLDDNFIERNSVYYTDGEYAYLSYSVNTSRISNFADTLFLKHNATISYNITDPIVITSDITVKLTFSEAQALMNRVDYTNELTKKIVDALFSRQSDIEDLADSKIDDFESELSRAAAPDISFEVPEYSFIDYETDYFSGSDFMDVLTSCPGYMILLTLGTSIWVVKVLLFGKG